MRKGQEGRERGQWEAHRRMFFGRPLQHGHMWTRAVRFVNHRSTADGRIMLNGMGYGREAARGSELRGVCGRLRGCAWPWLSHGYTDIELTARMSYTGCVLCICVQPATSRARHITRCEI